MATTWIIAADEGRARVLQVARPEQRLLEVETMLNPAGRLQDREINSDAAGRFAGPDRPGGHASDDERRTEAHQAELFARRVSDYLDKARNDRRFDELVLVAPPKFLGALRKELGKETARLVSEELPKDLSWLSRQELERHFAKGSAPGR